MKVSRERLVIVLFSLLGTSITGVMHGQGAAETEQSAAATRPPRESREVSDLIRRVQELAEQSQAELRRSREQNERLEQLLEQTHQELARLREEVDWMRSSMPSLSSNSQSPAPAASTGQGAVGKSGNAGNKPDSRNSLAARLTRVEDQVELNTAQIKEQAQTKVESDSRYRVRLFGMVLNNTYFNSSDSSDNSVPTVASHQGESSGHNLGATLRQTQIGFSMTGPKLGAARLSADVDFDFFGSAAAGYAGGYARNVLGSLRMRTAAVRLDGPKTSLAIGLMTPLISSLNPASFAAVYYPALGESGNLWQWLPQITVQRRLPVGEDTDLLLQGGLVMPFGETVNGAALPGRPGYESRLSYSRELGGEKQLEFGFGGYVQPRNFGFKRTVNSYAATGDWRIPLTRRLELSGEAFYGQGLSLSETSGADITYVFSFNGTPSDPLTKVHGIRSAGGWAQLNAKATAKLDFNFAFGLDDPRNQDIFAGLHKYDVRLKNEAFSINSVYRFRSNFLVSAEYRRLWTTYLEGQSTNNHLNLAIGYIF